MFFKRIKTKASQKLLNSFLNLRSVKFKTGKIKSVGIIFDFNNFQDYDFFKLFFTDLGVSINGIRFISLIGLKDDKPNSWDAFYSKDDFDWFGNCKNVEVDEFTSTPFDLLISYYKPNSHELNLVTAMSKANFKVGLTTEDKRLHDLILDVKPSQTSTFKIEMIKYLKTLNRI
tara:strand:- start:264 stop:782 length:519 start_codon:yes stop_codon:yes gene_type:complete